MKIIAIALNLAIVVCLLFARRPFGPRGGSLSENDPGAA
jgi:hypothetical protein